MVTQKISDKNREYLIEKAKIYKELDHLELACEEYKQKDYFSSLNLSRARLKFQERALCVETCRTFFTQDPKNISASFKCFHCPINDFISHWRTCPRYETFRTNRRLSLDEDLLDYYRDIIQLRLEEGWNDNRCIQPKPQWWFALMPRLYLELQTKQNSNTIKISSAHYGYILFEFVLR